MRNNEPHPIGRLRKRVRAEFDNRRLDKHCSNLLCWSGGAGRGLSWSAAPGTSLPPIPVSAGLTWLRSAPFLVCPVRHSEGDEEENRRAPSARQDSEPLSQCINRSSASINEPTSLRRLRSASDAHAPRANSQTNGPYSAKAAAPQTKPITIQFHTSSEL